MMLGTHASGSVQSGIGALPETLLASCTVRPSRPLSKTASAMGSSGEVFKRMMAIAATSSVKEATRRLQWDPLLTELSKARIVSDDLIIGLCKDDFMMRTGFTAPWSTESLVEPTAQQPTADHHLRRSIEQMLLPMPPTLIGLHELRMGRREPCGNDAIRKSLHCVLLEVLGI